MLLKGRRIIETGQDTINAAVSPDSSLLARVGKNLGFQLHNLETGMVIKEEKNDR